jgi:hypothetical protein
MKITNLVETPEGAVEVEANLSPEQVQFLIEVGLNVVLAKGAKPFLTSGDFGVDQVHAGTDTQQ